MENYQFLCPFCDPTLGVHRGAPDVMETRNFVMINGFRGTPFPFPPPPPNYSLSALIKVIHFILKYWKKLKVESFETIYIKDVYVIIFKGSICINMCQYVL